MIPKQKHNLSIINIFTVFIWDGAVENQTLTIVPFFKNQNKSIVKAKGKQNKSRIKPQRKHTKTKI